jgi:hypothetical protein
LRPSAARSCAVAVAAGAAYLLLAIVHTYPLIDHLGSHLPGRGLGDNVSFVWNLWWMREALASPERSFFTCPAIFAPLGGSLVLHTHTALSAAIGGTLLSRFSVLEAQNLLIIGSLALNGLAAYWLSYVVSGNRASSIVAGGLFVVAPAITGRLMGHFNLVVAWPLIFCCAAFVRWWRGATRLNTSMLALTAAMTLYADYYYTVFLALFAVVYVISDVWRPSWRVSQRTSRRWSTVFFACAAIAFSAGLAIALSERDELATGSLRLDIRSPINALTTAWLFALAGVFTRWRFHLGGDWQWREPAAVTLRRLIAPGIIFVVLASPLLRSAAQEWMAGNYVTQTSSLKSSPAGVDVATAVLGPPFSLGGARVRRWYERLHIDPMEASAWIGLVPAILLAIAIRRSRSDNELRRWVAVAAFFAVWALGPYLMVVGTNTGMLLPQAIGRFVPILNNARIPGRAMVMVEMSIAVVTAVLLGGMAKRRLSIVILSLVAIAGVSEALAAPLPLVRLPDAGVYDVLTAEQTSGAVLTIPFGVRDAFGSAGLFEHDALWAQTQHRHAIVGGFLARVPERVAAWYESREPYSTLLLLSEGKSVESWPSCESIVNGLEAASVSYVVLNRPDANPALLAFVSSRMPLRRDSEDGRRTLFRVAPDACSPAEQPFIRDSRPPVR